MSDEYKIVATPTFKITLTRLSHFLSRKFTQSHAEQTLATIKSTVLLLAQNPYAAPVSDRLSSLGITNYRQLLVDKHNLVYYRIDDSTKQVILVLVMDSRQSIKQLLYETMIYLD